MYDDWNWTIGEVVAPFGIKGEIKVRIESDFPDRFERLKQVCLRPRTGRAELRKVAGVRLHKGQALLRLEGIDSIEEVDKWRGARVQIPREEAVPLPAGSYYTVDLIGFDVVTKEGRTLGKLDRILPYPAQDLFQIGEILIPAVKEFIVSVDVPGRRIVVSPPDGLLPDETA